MQFKQQQKGGGMEKNKKQKTKGGGGDGKTVTYKIHRAANCWFAALFTLRRLALDPFTIISCRQGAIVASG
jgi:hypothetical protein